MTGTSAPGTGPVKNPADMREPVPGHDEAGPVGIHVAATPGGAAADRRRHPFLQSHRVAPRVADAADVPCPLIVPTWEEFKAMDLPPREMLLAPWLPRQGLGMLYGPRGCGKTWLAASIAFAVASGGGLCGKWNAPRSGRVLYVDGELPAPVLRERLLAADRGRNGATVDEHSVRIVAASIQSEGLRPLDTEAGQLALEPFLEDRDLVILDNLSSLIGCRENEADDWGPMQGYLLSLRRRGLAVLMVHHASKSGHQRGTSRREDVLDTVVALRKPADADPRAGASFELHFEKARGFWGEDAAPFRLSLDMGTTGGVSWLVSEIDADEVAGRMRDIEAIMELSDSGMSIRAISQELGISKSSVDRILRSRRGQ